jgi:hypothetical protein
MQRQRKRPIVKLLVAAVVSGLAALFSIATVIAGNGPGPWP